MAQQARMGTGPKCPGFTVTLRHTTLGMTVLDAPSQRPLPDNTQRLRQTSVLQAGLEPEIPASERPQTQASIPRGHQDRLICQYFTQLTILPSILTADEF
jgi:hypothetical protein